MKSKMIEKLFNLAYMDSMTGTLNRNSYEEQLKKLRQSRTVLDNISVVVVDIDDLKQINDTYGHHTGDEAICFVAEILKSTIGEKADVYRVGGDEFVCISDRSDVLPYVAQFIDYIGFENSERCCKVNVSVGYGTFNKNKHESIDDLIKCCDKKMYADKKKKHTSG